VNGLVACHQAIDIAGIVSIRGKGGIGGRSVGTLWILGVLSSGGEGERGSEPFCESKRTREPSVLPQL
jgi:hypothetical protein